MKILLTFLALSEGTGDESCDLSDALAKMTDVAFRGSYDRYKLVGTTKGSITQVDGWRQYNLGNFDAIVGTTSTFSGGTHCGSHGARKSTIHWSCGTKFEVTQSTEPNTCDYHFYAILPCCAVDDPTAWDPYAAPAVPETCHPDHETVVFGGLSCQKFFDDGLCNGDGSGGETLKLNDETFEDLMTDGFTARSCPQCGCVDAPTKCGDMFNGDPTSGCFTLSDDDECIITNPTCQSLTCTETRMTGSFRGDVIGLTSAPTTSALVNNAACSHVTYNEIDNTIAFDIALGDCGMEAEMIDSNIKFTSRIKFGEATEPNDEGIYLMASFGSSIAVSCSYSQEASTNDVTYQVTTKMDSYEINQVTTWADLELKFFADETYVAELEDSELDIGAPLYLQVLWDHTFGTDFPVKFYISKCAVSDNDGNEFNIIDESCGSQLVDSTLLSSEFSNSYIRYKYNSFSFTEEELVSEQTVTCTIGFCLQSDIASGACGSENNDCNGGR